MSRDQVMVYGARAQPKVRRRPPSPATVLDSASRQISRMAHDADRAEISAALGEAHGVIHLLTTGIAAMGMLDDLAGRCLGDEAARARRALYHAPHDASFVLAMAHSRIRALELEADREELAMALRLAQGLISELIAEVKSGLRTSPEPG